MTAAAPQRATVRRIPVKARVKARPDGAPAASGAPAAGGGAPGAPPKAPPRPPAAGGAPSGGGWAPIPNTRLGGYRKQRPGGGYAYHYPATSGGIPAHSHEVSEGETAAMGGLYARFKARAKAVLGQVVHAAKHTLHEFPIAGKALVKLAKGGKIDKHEAQSILSAGITVAHVALALGTGGAAAAALTAGKKISAHTLLHAVHKHLASAYTGYAGASLVGHVAHMALAEPGAPVTGKPPAAGGPPPAAQPPAEASDGAAAPDTGGEPDDEMAQSFSKLIMEAVEDVLASYRPDTAGSAAPRAPSPDADERPMVKAIGLLVRVSRPTSP